MSYPFFKIMVLVGLGYNLTGYITPGVFLAAVYIILYRMDLKNAKRE